MPVGLLLKQTFQNFQRHKGQWLAAAIAYFLTFAIAPLIIVVVEIAGLILGHHRAVLHEIYGYIQVTAGLGAAHAVQSIVSLTFNQKHSTAIAQAIAWVMFFVATIGLFTALQDALNTVWDIRPTKKALRDFIRHRAVAFGLIVVIALLLMASLALNSVLTVAGNAMAHVSVAFPFFIKALDFVISFLVLTGLFGVMFKFLPDCEVKWRDVWIGGAVTGLLFVIGQFLLGWYLGRAGVSSTFGAFASLIVFLVWTNYSAQIMLFGAEFTHVFAQSNASRQPHGLHLRHPRTARSRSPAGANR
ncbi:MAG: YihY/virulence factor BrkB family protein [Candidatus Eremiobacteraeota bacterium]|nr:YihY/virulence factor BrkB family protein [Candidatus Eremiobacteraeota bacterium]